MSDPTVIGRAVLAGLAKGRARAIAAAQARSRLLEEIICGLALADIQAGRPPRGRGKRIALQLRGRVSESQVNRLLRRLYSVRGAIGDTDRQVNQEAG